MLLIQIILLVFFLIALGKVERRFYKKELPWREALLWNIFWVAAGVVVVKPDSTFYFARILGVGRGADLIVYGALALLFFILFRLTVKIEHLNKQITLLTRRQALDERQKSDAQKNV